MRAKVWIAYGHVDYEDTVTLGVFTTRRSAEAACLHDRAERRFPYDDYSVCPAVIFRTVADWQKAETS